MLTSFIITVHVIVALVMIIVVLLQSGKGAGIGSGFGGSSQTVFGSRGPASFLSKFTTASAIIFMFTSMMLSVMSSKVGHSSLADQIRAKQLPIAPSTAVDPFKAVHEAQQKGLPTDAKPQSPVQAGSPIAPAANPDQKLPVDLKPLQQAQPTPGKKP